MKRVIRTDAAPAAVGPYSQAIEVDGWLWISGQIPLDPVSGELVGGGIEVATRRVLDNLRAVVESAGAGMRDVVRVTIYLTDLSQFQTVNSIYAETFDSDPPARACVEVSGLPKGAEVEMDAVVRLPRGAS
jgi:2-iminobutanoate/2-iminopropanoate deaminase